MVAQNVGKLEEWRPIRGYEGRYEISSCGRVKSLRRRSGSAQEDAKILRTANNRGYRMVGLSRHGMADLRLVHRLVADAFCIRARPEQTSVNHRNGIRDDNRRENLEWCTPLENVLHARDVLGTIGRASPRAKKTPRFPDELVAEIRHRVDGGESLCSIAREYRVSYSTMSRLVRGITHQKAGGPLAPTKPVVSSGALAWNLSGGWSFVPGKRQ